LRAAERQPATLRLVKQSKSSKMINSKDKVDFLVHVTFFCNFEPFLFRVRGDMRARPRYADADSANLRAISADKKQKSFEMVKKIHMQIFSFLTSEIPDLERFKAWNLYRVSQSELLNACKIVIAYVRRLKFCMWGTKCVKYQNSNHKLLYLMYVLLCMRNQIMQSNWKYLNQTAFMIWNFQVKTFTLLRNTKYFGLRAYIFERKTNTL
jgi:hypothetical protein